MQKFNVVDDRARARFYTTSPQIGAILRDHREKNNVLTFGIAEGGGGFFDNFLYSCTSCVSLMSPDGNWVQSCSELSNAK